VRPIYLDYTATTPVDPAVVEAMQPVLREHIGNPSSAHAYGRAAHDAVERSRRQVADRSVRPGALAEVRGMRESALDNPSVISCARQGSRPCSWPWSHKPAGGGFRTSRRPL